MPLPCSPVSCSDESDSTGDGFEERISSEPFSFDFRSTSISNRIQSSKARDNILAKPLATGRSRNRHIVHSSKSGSGERARATAPSNTIIEDPPYHATLPKRDSSSSSHTAGGNTAMAANNAVHGLPSPSRDGTSPRAPSGNRLGRDSEDIAESSADENTAIMVRKLPGRGTVDYGAVASVEEDGSQEVGMKQGGAHQDGKAGPTTNKRKSGSLIRASRDGTRNGATGAIPARGQEQLQRPDIEQPEQEGWFRTLVEKYGSVELENKGALSGPLHLIFNAC